MDETVEPELPNEIELVGYLHEALPIRDMVRVEERLRQSEAWRNALRRLQQQMDLGEHSIATIWRRHRLTCPDRERLGAYLQEMLLPDEMDYIRFHIEVVGCRLCQANQEDLQADIAESAAASTEERQLRQAASERRSRLFQTSIGHLPKPTTKT